MVCGKQPVIHMMPPLFSPPSLTLSLFFIVMFSGFSQELTSNQTPLDFKLPLNKV